MVIRVETFEEGKCVVVIDEKPQVYDNALEGAIAVAEALKLDAIFGKRVLTCVYCGHEYPQNTPAAGDKVLTDHIKVCSKHPLRAAESKIQTLRAALVELVGAEDRKELESMEAVTRTYMVYGAVPQKDGTNMINAIHAILATEREEPSPSILETKLQEVGIILAKLIDTAPCRFDHEGYCQEHNHLEGGVCSQQLMKSWLKENCPNIWKELN